MSKRNVFNELMEAVTYAQPYTAFGSIIKAIFIYGMPDFQTGVLVTYFDLRIHSLDDAAALLDIEYDAGYGTQEVYGTVLFNDGSWLSRGEYDGSEWWDYNQSPTINQVYDEA